MVPINNLMAKKKKIKKIILKWIDLLQKKKNYSEIQKHF